MTISAGTRLGRYEIVGRIGAGGMGEVWKARDTRLDRIVAIKTLPARLVEDAQARLRFEREAKTISQLSHPHICTLYDVGDGYLVMELIEGESLASRLQRGPLPIQEILRIGSQIADALDRAHRAGVVHRDLKPANVMLTKSGAKLLDFGLAKADDPQAAVSPDGVTQHMALTDVGMISGTLQYMAPEQLEGLALDGRTDIFALGALLYEMASGKPAFAPTSRTAVIAAIMNTEPQPISQVTPLPAAFEHVVRRCLAKDPEKRWRSAQDVAEELRWIAEGGSQPAIAGATGMPAARSREAKWLVGAAAAIVIAAAAAWLAAVRWTRAHEDVSVYRLTVTTPPGSVLGYNAGSMALSPDGRQLAFSSYSADGYTIAVRKLSETTWRTIDGTTGAHAPFWSADGKQIGFTARGSIWKVPVDGQVSPQEIAHLPSARSPSSGTWNSDGTIVFSNAGKLYRVSASGGEPVALHLLQGLARTPQFLPDGRHFVVTVHDDARGTNATAVGSLDPKEPPRPIADGENHASYSDGAVLFERAGTLYAQNFDVKRLALAGQPQPIAKIQAFQDGSAYFSVAAGTLVYLGEGNEVRTELQRVDRNGKRVATIAEPAFFFSPRISHDGTRVAVDQSAQNGLGDIWIFDAASGAATRATLDPDDESAPVWGPGDAEIVYFKTVASHDFLMRTRVAGGEPSVVFKPAGDAYPADWSPDGKSFVSMATGGPSNKVQITICSLPGWTANPTGIPARGVRLSPDGRWVAYAADEASTSQVFVQSYPPRGNKWQVSLDGGTLPVWSRDGKALFFVSPTGTLMESLVSVAADGSFAAQSPQKLFGAALREGGLIFAQYDVFPDGTFLLNRIPETATTPMTVVVHWKEGLGQ